MGYKNVPGNGLGQRISHHTTSGDMPQDNLPLRNHVSNVVMSDVYVFGLSMVLGVLCIGQGGHAVAVD